MGARLLIDVTQYANWPATSGVQRVLRHLAKEWPSGSIEARFGFIEKGRYLTGEIADLGSVIASTFGETRSNGVDLARRPTSVQKALRRAASGTVATRKVETSFDAYLLPEPSLREDNLAVATRLLHTRSVPSFFIYYDALRLTHPEYFPSDVDRELPVIRYNQVVARAENVACISAMTRAIFESRIARRKPEHAVVLRLGADGLERVDSPQPDLTTFTMVGTVEPRKRHLAVLEAIEHLWAAGDDYRLVVIGPPGSDTALAEILRTYARTRRVTWIEKANDEELAIALSKSAALVFISEAEGYGLPPLEALAVGCPVIVSTELPALEGLPEAGQLRLGTIDAATIASGLQELADPVSNAAYRRAIENLRLPTWAQFTAALEQWIGLVLSKERGGDKSA